ncbi:MAG: hypothetical protein EON88_36885, partial [Brevundimonas sp.]
MAGWFTIPAHRPFLADLARGVLAGLDPAAPERLADGVILLPNRRAARALSDAFAEIGADRPLLLPQIRPLGDIEEDEPPFAPGDIGLDLGLDDRAWDAVDDQHPQGAMKRLLDRSGVTRDRVAVWGGA